jgi:hypothetical protein
VMSPSRSGRRGVRPDRDSDCVTPARLARRPARGRTDSRFRPTPVHIGPARGDTGTRFPFRDADTVTSSVGSGRLTCGEDFAHRDHR